MRTYFSRVPSTSIHSPRADAALLAGSAVIALVGIMAVREGGATVWWMAGACVVLLTLVLVRVVGVWALVVAPGIVQLCFNNWWTVLVGLRSIELSTGEYLARLFAINRPRRDLRT